VKLCQLERGEENLKFLVGLHISKRMIKFLVSNWIRAFHSLQGRDNGGGKCWIMFQVPFKIKRITMETCSIINNLLLAGKIVHETSLDWKIHIMAQLSASIWRRMKCFYIVNDFVLCILSSFHKSLLTAPPIYILTIINIWPLEMIMHFPISFSIHYPHQVSA
jgi:hypothetical protein